MSGPTDVIRELWAEQPIRLDRWTVPRGCVRSQRREPDGSYTVFLAPGEHDAPPQVRLAGRWAGLGEELAHSVPTYAVTPAGLVLLPREG